MLPWPSPFSRPPIRCSRPGVPGAATGRATPAPPAAPSRPTTADPVLQARGARHGPRPGQRGLIALVGPELGLVAITVVGRRRETGVDRRQLGDLRDAPRLR